jgi:hypothetical protein
MSNSDKGIPKYRPVAVLKVKTAGPIEWISTKFDSDTHIESLQSIGIQNLQLSMLIAIVDIKYSEIFKKHC